MKILNVLFLISALALAGCSLHNDVHFTPFTNPGAETFAPTNPADVKIYSSRLPEGPFVELGLMTLRSLHVPDDRSFVFERFRNTAASVGANGILLQQDRAINSSPRIGRYNTFSDGPGDTFVFSATAIRVKE